MPFNFLPTGFLPTGFLPVGWWAGAANLPPVVDLPPHLAGAIAARFAEAEALGDYFAGGIFQDKVKLGAASPYLVFEISSGGAGFVSASSTWTNSKIRFRSIARSGATAVAGALLVRAAFADRVLEFESGFTSRLIPDAEPSAAVATGRGKDNVQLYRSTIDFRCMTRVGRG